MNTMNTSTNFHTQSNLIRQSDRTELGLGMLQKMDRLKDSDLRILIFTATYFVLDGVTLTIRRLESHMRSRGATVKIVSTVPENIDPAQLQNVIVVPGIKIPFNHAGDYSFGVGLDESTLNEIEKFNPNIVHFTVPDFVALDGIRWCQRNEIAYVGTWHSNYTEYLKYYFLEWILGPGLNRYLRGFFEQIPTIYVPTPYMLKKMREDWGYGTATELKEWGRGVDMSIFTPDRRSQSFRSAKGINESDVVVLWVSRIVPEKRPEIWFEVVKRLQDEGLPVKPLVVGSGTFERNFSMLKNVTCCGWLSGTALGEAYASSDILLFPSDVETFGNVTLEALSSGCPSIVERKCGEHLVENGINGLTCPAGDLEAFYEATRKLVLDEHLRKQMAKTAREKAAKYERSIILQQMLENYKDAIQKHKDPAYLKRHLENPEGAGRNILSVLCCNYYFIKIVAEPFLNTSRGVQDMVEGTTECVQMTRSRLSCTEFLSSANLTALPSIGEDIETGINEKKFDDRNRKTRKSSNWSSCLTCFCSALTSVTAGRIVHWFGVIVALGVVFLFVYASFTV